jgi:UDP-glucose 4-epimerase
VSQLDSPSEIRLIPYSEAYGPGYEDMRRRVPDNTLAGQLVGFRPRTTIEEIIDRVAASMSVPAAAGSAHTHH